MPKISVIIKNTEIQTSDVYISVFFNHFSDLGQNAQIPAAETYYENIEPIVLKL